MKSNNDNESAAADRLVGSRIKELRLKHGWSQEELAKRMGYTAANSRSTISKIENGDNGIDQSTLIKFAKIFGTSPVYLLGMCEMYDCWDSKHETDVLSHQSKCLADISKIFGDDVTKILICFVQLNEEGRKQAIQSIEHLLEQYKE